jgi:malate synthase
MSRRTWKRLAGVVAATVVLQGYPVLAADEGAKAPEAAGLESAKQGMEQLHKQIKEREQAVLAKDAQLKQELEALDKQIKEGKEAAKAAPGTGREEIKKLMKERQEKLVAADPELAELYKKLEAARRDAGGKAPKPGKPEKPAREGDQGGGKKHGAKAE